MSAIALPYIIKRCSMCKEFDRSANIDGHNWLYCRMSGFIRPYDLDEERSAASISACKFFAPRKRPAVKKVKVPKPVQGLLFDVEDLPHERL